MSDRRPRARTRVALRIAAGPGPAFLAAAADAVRGSPHADVVLILVAPPSARPLTGRGRVVAAAEAAFAALERAVLRGGPPALAPVGPATWPPDIPVVTAREADRRADALLAARADVVIDLVPEDDREALPVPAGGWWRLRYRTGSDPRDSATLPRPAATTDLAVSMLSIGLPGDVVHETEVGTHALHRIGFGRDRDAAYWRSARLPARRLARAAPVAAAKPEAEAEARSSPPRTVGRRRTPVPPIVGLARAVLARVVGRALYRSGWVVLVRRRQPDDAPPADLSGFQVVPSPRGRFYADPFVVAAPDGPRLLVEDCPDGRHEGRISQLRHDAGRWRFDRVLLEDTAHRAYPHAIATAAGLVVTADSGRAGGVDVFLRPDPASGLTRIGRALEGLPVSDPTLLVHDGRFWLFVALTEHGMSPWDELHVFVSATLEGPWHTHPRNPVVADVRRARPAGRIFRRGDAWIRPGQDCSDVYGRRIVLSEILVLTPDDYRERPIATIEPAGLADMQRTHTYTFDGTTEALDAYRRVPRYPRPGSR